MGIVATASVRLQQTKQFSAPKANRHLGVLMPRLRISAKNDFFQTIDSVKKQGEMALVEVQK